MEPPPVDAPPKASPLKSACCCLLGLLLLGAVALIALSALQPSRPGQDAFYAANRQVTGKGDGVAYGNTPAAKDLARRYSEAIGGMQELMFTGGKEELGRLSLTGGKFLTYCQLRDDRICFVVHVPQLKNYKREVRDALIQLAWTTAQVITEDLRRDEDRRLGVGLRGAVFFGGVAVGMGAQDPPPTLENGAAVAPTPLFEFFLDEPTPD